jgi:hypothetical protein
MSLADRFRTRRNQMENPQREATELPVSYPQQTSPRNHPSEHGSLTTTHTNSLIDPESLADLTLEERTVRFFSAITQMMPGVGSNPLMTELLKRLGPMLVKELAGMPRDELDKVYQGMFVSLGQIYAPHAVALAIDLRQGHVLIEEVEAAIGPRPYIAVEDAEAFAVAVGGRTEPLALPAAPPALEAVLEPEAQPVFASVERDPRLPDAPPPPPMPVDTAADDPLVGIEIDGVVVAMRQSEVKALLAAPTAEPA